MTFQLDIEARVFKTIAYYPLKHQKQIKQKILALQDNPLPNDSRKLIGFPYRRCDIGEYRIIYKIDGKIIRITLVGQRNDDDIYKKLQRMQH